MNQILVNNFISQINQVISGQPWLDEWFEKKLSNISEEEAFKKPGPDINSVAENLSHITQWRFEILRRFELGHRTMWIDDPRNWISNEDLKKDGWQALKDNFHKSQDQLVEYLKDKPDEFLETPYADKDFGYLLEGILHHDLYHLGQIGLILKLNKLKKN